MARIYYSSNEAESYKGALGVLFHDNIDAAIWHAKLNLVGSKIFEANKVRVEMHGENTAHLIYDNEDEGVLAMDWVNSNKVYS